MNTRQIPFPKNVSVIDNITEVMSFQEVLDLRNNCFFKKSSKGQQIYEQMFNITTHKGSANEECNEISSHTF